jgi:hypothetical protein
MTPKYDPLRMWLSQATDERIRLSFQEIEAVLGFPLPASARRLAQWWANAAGSHVQAVAWMSAGWRACEVDVAGEQVSFERTVWRREAPRTSQDRVGVAEPGAAFVADDVIVIDRAALRGGALRLLEEHRETHGGSLGEAAAAVLNEIVMERRRQLLDWFRTHSPRVPGDSTDIIREDRDGR